VLTETEELLRREAKARKDATASLEWLAARGASRLPSITLSGHGRPGIAGT